MKHVHDIDPGDWRRCFGSERFCHSLEYQRSVELDEHPGVTFHYLIVERLGHVEAIVGCFLYRMPLGLAATPKTKRVIDAIEHVAPRAFTLETFVAGHLTAVCDHLFGLRMIPEAERSAFLEVVEPELRRRAWALGCSIVAIKEIPARDRSAFERALSSEYLFVPSLPAMTLAIDPHQPYAAQLRSKYRRVMRRRARDAQKRGLTFSTHRGPISDELATRMEQLYRHVVDRAEVRFEVLSARFFSALMERCAGSTLVLCHDGVELVGFVVGVEGGKASCLLYLGIDPDYRDDGVYFNLLLRALEEARSRGSGTIELGQTSYEAKSSLGAKPAAVFVALRARRWLVRILLRVFRSQLVSQPDIPARHPLKSGASKSGAEPSSPALGRVRGVAA